MKRKITVIVSVMMFLLVGSFIAIANAEGYECSKKSGYSKGLDSKVFCKARFLIQNREELKLTDEQVAKIKDLKIQAKKGLIMKKAEIEVLAIDIKAKLYEDTINIEELNKLVDQKYELKKAKAKFFVEKYANLKNILTAEQKEEVKALLRKCDKK